MLSKKSKIVKLLWELHGHYLPKLEAALFAATLSVAASPSSPPCCNGARQTGQVPLIRSHGKMHFSWNKWLHGSLRTSLSANRNSSKQTEHWVLESVCSWVMVICGISDSLVWLTGGGRGELRNDDIRSSRSKWKARLDRPRSRRRVVVDDPAPLSPSRRSIDPTKNVMRGERLRLLVLLLARLLAVWARDLRVIGGEMSLIMRWMMEKSGSELLSRSTGRLLASLTSSIKPCWHCGHEKS